MRILPLIAILAAACLWHTAARAADAGDTPITHDPWTLQRQVYLRNSVNAQKDAYPQRGAAYLEGVSGNEQQWWDRWLSHLPYDRGQSYTTPSADMIDTTPYLIMSSGAIAHTPSAAPSSPTDDAGQPLPNGPSDANRSTAPVEPLPASQIYGQ